MEVDARQCFKEIFGQLGIHWTTSVEELKELEVFTCQLYGSIGV